MVNWLYRDKEILKHSDLDDRCTDFVYEISYEDGTKYIGKKTVRANRRVQPTKAQLAIRKNYKRVEHKDIPFAKYIGSSSENEGKTVVKKEIIFQCSNKQTASYLEVKLLFITGAIEQDGYNNKNISGRYFDNCLSGLLQA